MTFDQINLNRDGMYYSLKTPTATVEIISTPWHPEDLATKCNIQLDDSFETRYGPTMRHFFIDDDEQP